LLFVDGFLFLAPTLGAGVAVENENCLTNENARQRKNENAN